MARKNNAENPRRVSRPEPSQVAKQVLPIVSGEIVKGLSVVNANVNQVVGQLEILGAREIPVQNVDPAQMGRDLAGGSLGLLDLLDKEDTLERFRDIVGALKGRDVNEVAGKLRQIVTANLLDQESDERRDRILKFIGISLRGRSKNKALKSLGLDSEFLSVPEVRMALGISLTFAEAALIYKGIMDRVGKNLAEIDKRNAEDSGNAEKIKKTAIEEIGKRDTSWVELQKVVKEAEIEAAGMIGSDATEVTGARFEKAAEVLKRRAEETKKHSDAVTKLTEKNIQMGSLLDGIPDDEDTREALLLLLGEAAGGFLVCLRGVRLPLVCIKMGLVNGVTLKLAGATEALLEKTKVIRGQNRIFINGAQQSLRLARKSSSGDKATVVDGEVKELPKKEN